MGVYDYHRETQASGPVTLRGKMPEVTEGNPFKVYVEVLARFTTDGQLTILPFYIRTVRSFILFLSLAFRNSSFFVREQENRGCVYC